MRDSNGAIRVFIAIHISVDARRALAELIERLAETVPRGVRWVDPKGIHLTLKFLGDIDPSQGDPHRRSIFSYPMSGCFPTSGGPGCCGPE